MLRKLISLSICLVFLSGLAKGQDDKDSVPFRNPKYIGYRLALTDIEVKSGRNDQWQISFTAINTGREDIILGKSIAPPPSLVVNFDPSLEQLQLDGKMSDIREQLLKSDFYIAAGDIKTGPKLQFTGKKPSNTQLATTPAPEPQADTPEVLTEKGNESGEIVETNTTPEEEGCPDLIIEKVQILKKSKKWVTLEYTIYNQGAGTAYIEGPTKRDEDDLAIRAYMSRSERLTRGSITIGGDYLGSARGIIPPGERLVQKTRFDIRSLTKFTPVIILELDPYMTITECDETNNKNHIQVLPDTN